MAQIGVSDLDPGTARIVERARQGEAIEVTDGGRVVARLEPVAHVPELLERIVMEGRAVAPTATGTLPLPPVIGDPDVDVASVLAGLRDEGPW